MVAKAISEPIADIRLTFPDDRTVGKAADSQSKINRAWPQTPIPRLSGTLRLVEGVEWPVLDEHVVDLDRTEQALAARTLQ